MCNCVHKKKDSLSENKKSLSFPRALNGNLHRNLPISNVSPIESLGDDMFSDRLGVCERAEAGMYFISRDLEVAEKSIHGQQLTPYLFNSH